jgi:hypothetical protein
LHQYTGRELESREAEKMPPNYNPRITAAKEMLLSETYCEVNLHTVKLKKESCQSCGGRKQRKSMFRIELRDQRESSAFHGPAWLLGVIFQW